MHDSSTRQQVANLQWFHSIDFGGGLISPGTDDSPAKLARAAIPDDLSGKRVLDVGAYDGFFSFEAERRGAADVLAIDTLAWERGLTSGWPCFELARRILASQVKAQRLDAMEVCREELGGFDLVLFLGVLYHLRDPLGALERIASVTDGLLILETHTDLNSIKRASMRFYANDELAGDASNWWGPNEPALEAFLRDVGFREIRVVHRRPLSQRILRSLYGAHWRFDQIFRIADQGRVVVHATK